MLALQDTGNVVRQPTPPALSPAVRIPACVSQRVHPAVCIPACVSQRVCHATQRYMYRPLGVREGTVRHPQPQPWRTHTCVPVRPVADAGLTVNIAGVDGEDVELVFATAEGKVVSVVCKVGQAATATATFDGTAAKCA